MCPASTHTDEKEFEIQRLAMVELLRRHGIADPQVLEAFRTVPRHRFVPADERSEAYANYPLPIGEGQTISQPLMVAIMTEALRCGPGHRVLEVGTGSGYQAALLAELAERVVTIDRVARLAWRAERVLRELGYRNIDIVVGDGTLGVPEHAPYDRIIVTAGAPRVPGALVDQLARGGRLAVPVGDRSLQDLVVVTKDASGGIREESHGGCVFVPLIGEDGWRPSTFDPTDPRG